MSACVLDPSTRTPEIMNLGEQETSSNTERLTGCRIDRFRKTEHLILFDQNFRLKSQFIRLHHCLFFPYFSPFLFIFS